VDSLQGETDQVFPPRAPVAERRGRRLLVSIVGIAGLSARIQLAPFGVEA